jgi:hypothetical protein
MTATIKTLTADQETRLAKYRDRWTEFRLGVRPVD